MRDSSLYMLAKFVVIEGLDRSGKSTISKMIQEKLATKASSAVISFPNRSTSIGKTINQFLTNQKDFPAQAIHLLFSANRWECMPEIEARLAGGTNIVCDRYWYSGVAYSAAKGLSFQWCLEADKGLRKPDIVFYLRANPELLSKRAGYGEERYEQLEFQKRVHSQFELIFKQENNVHIIELESKDQSAIWREVEAVLDSIL